MTWFEVLFVPKATAALALVIWGLVLRARIHREDHARGTASDQAGASSASPPAGIAAL